MKIYWHCIIELDIKEGTLPNGADSPLRNAVEDAALNLMSYSKHINTWSGWGLSSSGAANVLNETNKEINRVSTEDVVKRSVPL